MEPCSEELHSTLASCRINSISSSFSSGRDIVYAYQPRTVLE